MTVIDIREDNDISEVFLDFSDEVIEGTPEEKCRTTAKVAGDPAFYIQSLASDFRVNNPGLFPPEEAEVGDGIPMMEDRAETEGEEG